MKKQWFHCFWLTKIILLCLCSVVMAQSGPKMVLKESTFDFGMANEGKVIEHTFFVENQGDQPLIIKRVDPG